MKHMAIKLLIAEQTPGNWSEFESGFSIKQVSSIAEVRSKVKSVDYEIVITDYFLKDGVCIDFFKELENIPVIVMVPEGDAEAALISVKTGASDFLVKDKGCYYMKFLPLRINRSLEMKNQADELKKYRYQLENIVEERTIELIDMYTKLQESETNFRNIFNSSSEGIIITDSEMKFIEANDAVLNQMGVSKQFLATHELSNYVVPEYHKVLYEKLEIVKSGNPTGSFELEIISPSNGSLMPYEFSCVPIIFNQGNAILAIMHDITERKNHARKLFETIIQTEEEERKRIASDLHDEIGPLISALKIFTTSFIEATNSDKKDKLAQKMGTIVREVIDSIKTISNDMSPHVLMNFGLHAAIVNFIDLFTRSIKIKFKSNIESIRFPETIESLIYRIYKELLNNTVKHAHAREVDIHIEYVNDHLICSYRDDGIGFDWNQQTQMPAKGMGINNIITRIRSLGGDFTVKSEPDKGFAIIFELQTIHK
ncbi:MAG TPA: PAS domain S-box protein [Bacteroidales bacterium]|nr:PAS domain S-box protein [Bacteroidales bacterium]